MFIIIIVNFEGLGVVPVS